MKVNIAIEEVYRIQEERRAINKLEFQDIVWTENGKPINIPAEVLHTWLFCGLNNMDFIMAGQHRPDAWVPPILQS